MPASPPRLVLASASPRRRQLLRLTGVPFRCCPSHHLEATRDGEAPRSRARRLAREKATWVASRLRAPAWVLGADTLVVVGGEILEKPRSAADAARMLRQLSGRWHQVISAVALLPARLSGEAPMEGWRMTRVRFGPLAPRHVHWILATGEHTDKAGAYAAQGRASAFIREIRGSFSNVVGLPLDLTMEFLGCSGFVPAPVSSPRRERNGTRRRSSVPRSVIPRQG
jgi:septum formation protein